MSAKSSGNDASIVCYLGRCNHFTQGEPEWIAEAINEAPLLHRRTAGDLWPPGHDSDQEPPRSPGFVPRFACRNNGFVMPSPGVLGDFWSDLGKQCEASEGCETPCAYTDTLAVAQVPSELLVPC